MLRAVTALRGRLSGNSLRAYAESTLAPFYISLSRHVTKTALEFLKSHILHVWVFLQDLTHHCAGLTACLTQSFPVRHCLSLISWVLTRREMLICRTELIVLISRNWSGEVMCLYFFSVLSHRRILPASPLNHPFQSLSPLSAGRRGDQVKWIH